MVAFDTNSKLVVILLVGFILKKSIFIHYFYHYFGIALYYRLRPLIVSTCSSGFSLYVPTCTIFTKFLRESLVADFVEFYI